MAFIYIYIYFIFLKFEKVEKTGIVATKISLRCTQSVILGGQCFPLSFLTQLLIQAKKRGMGFPSIVAVAELRKIDDTSLSK